MSDDKKKLISETVENLKHLDKESLLIIKSGAEMLKIRDSMNELSCSEEGPEPLEGGR